MSKISDIAKTINVTIKDPAHCGYKRFVGLEHYDSGEPQITRYGSTELLTTTVKHFLSGDILLARRNVNLRRAGRVDFEGITSGDSIVLRPINPLVGNILPFILNTTDFWDYAEENSDGTMSKRLSPEMLLQYEFDLPSEEEQKQLAKKLWAAYRLKESYKKMIEATDEMVKSQFIEMFGNPFLNDKNWERYETLESATQIVLGSTPDTKNPSYWDGEYRWITPAEMDDNTFIVNDTVRHITQEGINKAHLTLMPEGSVLLSTRAPIGKIGIVGKEMCCNQGFKNFICGDDIDSIFLYYTLKLNKVTLCSMGTGTTFKELSRKSVASIKVSIPPIQLQKQFGDIYLQADKSKFVYQKICRTTLCS